jgi:Protein of unknown function (DUF2505)
MKFRHDLSYDAGVDEVYAMLADPVFREEVCQAARVIRHSVTITPRTAGMTVEVNQTQPAKGIPSFAKKFVGDEIHIVQAEDWPDSSGAALDVAIPGKPGHFKGSIALTDNGSGTVETVAGEIKVNIPLLGGKLEKLIADMLLAALKSEQKVARTWLAADR